MLNNLIEAYIALLKIEPQQHWRVTNQDVYASIRDEIASLSKIDAETVQDTFENLIIIENMGKHHA